MAECLAGLWREGVEHDGPNHGGNGEDREACEANVQRRGGELQVGDVDGAEEEARHHEGVEHDGLNHRGNDDDREAREANVQGRGGQLQVGDVERVRKRKLGMPKT